MFNPKITQASDEQNVYNEGCLSFPKLYADVMRPKEVTVEWLDQNGNPQETDFDGLWATCVQHEIDHLNGKLFVDHLKSVKRKTITEKAVKIKKKGFEYA